MTTAHQDFFSLRRYRLELDGVVQGAFARYEPPGRQVSPRPDGGVDALKTPAVLEDGLANPRALLGWLSTAMDGPGGRRQAAIVEVDDSGRTVARHVLDGAWPQTVRLSTGPVDPPFAIGQLSLRSEAWSRHAPTP